MTETKQPVRLAGSVLNRTCHACAFFNSREEEYDVLLPFAKEGYERGEKLFHVVDREHRPERLRRLAEAGILANGAERAGGGPPVGGRLPAGRPVRQERHARADPGGPGERQGAGTA